MVDYMDISISCAFEGVSRGDNTAEKEGMYGKDVCTAQLGHENLIS